MKMLKCSIISALIVTFAFMFLIKSLSKIDITIEPPEIKELSKPAEQRSVEPIPAPIEESSEICIEYSEESLEESSCEEFSEEPSKEETNDITLQECEPTIPKESLFVPIHSVQEETNETIEKGITVNLYNSYSEDFNRADAEWFFREIVTICTQLNLDGIPIEALLAQAYTEGGAGKSGLYRYSNNLFGIRAGSNWNGLVYSRSLKMLFENYETACLFGGQDLFRAYSNLTESVKDYINLITTSELYKGALGKSAKQYLKYIAKAGYGDTDMVNVWLELIKKYKLKEYAYDSCD